ncbi:MAG TPA: CU044_2847 family protein [Micromonosporaceae bacterium]|nr:CU044_2847 family protein [Micromonosporaceae bacterium]
MAGVQVVTYEVDDDTTVRFEVEPVEGFVPAGLDEIAGRVQEAVAPAVAAARAVLGQVRALSPDGVEVKFGVKVTGTANWFVAKAATEGNFEVTLSWQPDRAGGSGDTPHQ